jgi:hypothetical protein
LPTTKEQKEKEKLAKEIEGTLWEVGKEPVKNKQLDLS